jgi:hypothetical protein
MAKNKTAVIVDGYRSGHYLAPKLIERGYQCIHVQSISSFSREILKSYEPKNYIKNIVSRA